MRRLLLLCLALLVSTSGAQSQDTSVYFGCDLPTWGLNCTPPERMAILRAKVDIDDLRLVFPPLNPADSLDRVLLLSELVPVHNDENIEWKSTSNIANENPLLPVPLPILLGCNSNDAECLSARVMASVFPVKDRPDLLALNLYGGGIGAQACDPDREQNLDPGDAFFPDCTDGEVFYDFIQVGGQNRNYIEFVHASSSYRPVTVPVRVRARTYGRAESPDSNRFEAATKFAVGVGRFWQLAERSYRFEVGNESPVVQTGASRSFGVTVSLSTQELNSQNTYRDTTRFTGGAKYNALVLSPAIALQTGVENVSAGLYIGFDVIPFSGAEAWDYQWSPWIGLGVSTELGFLFF